MTHESLMEIKIDVLPKDKMILRLAGIILILTFLLSALLYNPFESHLLTCHFKNLTGYDCPTCGLSRSVYSFLSLKFQDSLRYNPLGFILVSGLLIFLLKFSTEIIIKKEIVVPTTQSFRRYVVIFLLLLVLSTWIFKLCLKF